MKHLKVFGKDYVYELWSEIKNILKNWRTNYSTDRFRKYYPSRYGNQRRLLRYRRNVSPRNGYSCYHLRNRATRPAYKDNRFRELHLSPWLDKTLSRKALTEESIFAGRPRNTGYITAAKWSFCYLLKTINSSSFCTIMYFFCQFYRFNSADNRLF
jgi:hypothetical protein